MYAQAMDEEPPAARVADGRRAPLRWEPDSDEAPADEREAGDEAGARLVGHLQSVAEPVATAVEPIVSHVVGPVAGALGTVFGAANTAISGHNALERRLRRLNRRPLANLYELYPQVRRAAPRELGLRFVPLDEIRGTAVAGGAQRGGDFRPLAPFRGENWEARWRRIREANERLQPLPPVDLIKFEGAYWVVDGHNRVAAALYADGAGLDAMVTELIPLDGQTSERPTDLAGLLSEAGELRAAAAGHRPAFGMRYGDQQLPDEAEAPEDAAPAATPPNVTPPAGDPSAVSSGRPAPRPPEPVEH
jgi:hypothetical protein